MNLFRTDRRVAHYSRRTSIVRTGTIKTDPGVPQKRGTLLKLILLVSIPLGTLVALAGVTLLSASDAIGSANDLKAQIDNTNRLVTLMNALQRERGSSCFYLSTASPTERGNMEVSKLLNKYRAETDAAVEALKQHLWIEHSKLDQLDQFRDQIGVTVDTCQPVLEWYTCVVHYLLEEIKSIQRSSSKEGLFWAHLSDLNLLFTAQDLTGIKRGLGGVYYGSCGFDADTLRQFEEARSGSELFLERVLFNNPALKSMHYYLTVENRPLLDNLKAFDAEILANNCTEADTTKGLLWFESSTEYMALMSQLERQLSNSILESLDGRVEQNRTSFWITFAVVVGIVAICPPLTFFHGIKSHKLLLRVAEFAYEMHKRDEQIKAEKLSTEELLCQMLPVSVAAILLNGGTVEPEKYTEVTIYFSDITGFSDLCTKSSPTQIIALLNEFCAKCDQIIDLYDCYKVQSTVDGCMVVSGLPHRNDLKHSDEICTMALEMLQNIKEFTIPHMRSKKISIRIGIHTGPCTTGVVGSKLPRFCLFGETVTVASKIESNSLADRIQISGATYQHLSKYHHTFETVPRGSIEIKGKGAMNTFWLVGKEDLSFRIDLDGTHSMMARLDVMSDQCSSVRSSAVTIESNLSSARFQNAKQSP